MECRNLDLTIISADDLKNVNLFSEIMKVYVVVSILDSTYHHHPSYDQKQKTPVDKHGNRNPKWNFTAKFTLNDAALQNNRLTLYFRIFSKRSLLPNKLVGEVHVSASDLLSSIGKADRQHMSYQVRKKSEKPKGALNFSYKFGESFTASAPASGPGPSTAYLYPPPTGPGYSEPQYAYRAEPAGVAYAYPAQGYGYGYGNVYPPPQAQRRRNSLGMGMGTGLLGGALAGFLIGDLVSDIGNDSGYYDGGFDDGGFDFGGF